MGPAPSGGVSTRGDGDGDGSGEDEPDGGAAGSVDAAAGAGDAASGGEVSAAACEHSVAREGQRPNCGDLRTLLDCRSFGRQRIGGPAPRVAKVVDLDGDGREDLVAQGEDGTAFVRLAGRDGLAEGCSQELGFDGDIGELAFGDLNDDGDADAVDRELNVYLGDGSGQLGAPIAFDTAAAGLDSVGAPLLGDFDSDGSDEVFVTARSMADEGLLLVLSFDNSALTEDARLVAELVDGARISSDADADGDLDVISAGAGADGALTVEMAVFEAGIVDSVASSAFPTLAPGAPALIADDYDLDMRADLILPAEQVDMQNSGIVVLKGAPGGTFIQASFTAGAASAVFMAGRTESCDRPFIIGFDTDHPNLFEVDTGLQLTLADDWNLDGASQLLAAADFDGDGRVELAGVGGGLSVWEPSSCPLR